MANGRVSVGVKREIKSRFNAFFDLFSTSVPRFFSGNGRHLNMGDGPFSLPRRVRHFPRFSLPFFAFSGLFSN